MTKPRRSLKWVLTRRLIVLQGFLLFLFIALLGAWIWILDPELESTNDSIIRAVAENAVRKADGSLDVTETPEIAQLKAEYPDLWFIVRDAAGNTFQYGSYPEALMSTPFPASIDGATLKVGNGTYPAVANRETPLGRLQVIAAADRLNSKNDGIKFWVNIDADFEVAEGTSPTLFWLQIVPATGLVIFVCFLPIAIIVGAATVLATPFSIGRSLTGLVETANEARNIEFAKRSARLDASIVPTEIVPLVEAFNEALRKLDDGYQRHSRFLADAAHELRTPIAIVRTRADLLPESDVSRHLLRDIERLSRLAHQLLDIQSVGEISQEVQTVDLNDFTGKIAIDLAPIAIDAGYDFVFEPGGGLTPAAVQPYAIELALTNLIRNAIDHGGGKGTITVQVNQKGWIDICDQGPGVSVMERLRVFEPFHRLNLQSPGAGLGLNLAQKAAELHGGKVHFLDGQDCFIVRFELGAPHLL
jgi:signal transduction histidine kinase